ncbi:MAG: hypothetical protein LH466_10770 [Sphingomonas bacterium]|nr:hypothetical protein [Sphingomonas bacterium]
MSRSTRFLAFALVGWIGLRAVSLGLIPGGEAIAFDRRAPGGSANLASTETPLPRLATTQFAPIEPVAPAPLPPTYLPGAGFAAYPMPYAVPVYAAGLSPARVSAGRSAAALAIPYGWGPDEAQAYSLAPAAARYASSAPPLEQWPLAAIVSGSGAPALRRAQSTPAEMIRAIRGIDRLSMSAWAMMRRDPGSPSLAANGQLGGSQAGARFLWRFDPRFAASIRSSAPIGGVQRTAELAAGVRWQPFVRVPVALTAERRQSFGRDKGASAFALFAEGGVYDRPILAGFNLDAYLQAGVVGVRDRAAFVDGSATLTRPLWRQFSAGFGVWGGAQPGLARLDVGPRASLRLGRSMRVHLDYRHRLVGQAAPGSGPVVTLAADF